MNRSIRVLLIEDSPGDARLISELLKEAHNVSFVVEREDRLCTGISRLGRGDIDVVLLDPGLPDSQGIDTLRRVLERARTVPIIMFTVNSNETQGVKAIQEGAQDYIVKGQMDSNLLSRTIRYAIERKRIKEELEISLKEWKNTFKAISDGVWILDKDGRVLQSNGVLESLFGKTPDEVIGQYCYSIVHCTSNFIEECPFTRMKQTGIRESFEMEDKKRGLWLQVTLDPIRDDSGEIINAVHIVRDITDIKRAEETRFENIRLILANKTKSDFLAHMSHELRTPLNSIIGFSELMLHNTIGELNTKQVHYTENIVRSSKTLLSLINDILDLSKVEAGKIELFVEKISVPETVNDALMLIKERASKHKVKIIKEIDPHLEIEVDKQRFKQILFNLLDNAVKFSKKEGGTVTIQTRKEGDMARFSITDTGIGIKEKDLGRIFNEFEQLDSGLSRKYEGSGLGLSITKKLVELHRGKIWAESEFGKGSTFIFMLPCILKKMENEGV